MRCPAQLPGHLALTKSVGLLLQYVISKPIQKGTGRTVYYIILKVFMMFMICFDVYEIRKAIRKGGTT